MQRDPWLSKATVYLTSTSHLAICRRTRCVLVEWCLAQGKLLYLSTWHEVSDAGGLTARLKRKLKGAGASTEAAFFVRSRGRDT